MLLQGLPVVMKGVTDIGKQAECYAGDRDGRDDGHSSGIREAKHMSHRSVPVYPVMEQERGTKGGSNSMVTEEHEWGSVALGLSECAMLGSTIGDVRGCHFKPSVCAGFCTRRERVRKNAKTVGEAPAH